MATLHTAYKVLSPNVETVGDSHSMFANAASAQQADCSQATFENMERCARMGLRAKGNYFQHFL
jgi:hypothetical protein